MATAIDFLKAVNVYYVKDGVTYTAKSVKTSDGAVVWPLVTYDASYSVNNGLTYSGSSQTGITLTNCVLSSGSRTATDAGTYYAVITPKDGHGWSDGTTGSKTVYWSIGKATPSNCASISVTQCAKGTECEFTITFDSAMDQAITYNYEIQRDGYSTFTGLTFTLSAGSKSKTVASGKTPTGSSGKWTVALKSSDATSNYDSRTYTRTGSKSW